MTEKRLKITLDTNTFLLEHVDFLTIGQADVKTTTDTAREVGSKWKPELSVLQLRHDAVLGSQADADLIEKALAVITRGAFPKRGDRGNLTLSQKCQLHDAMIFCTHVREGRDMFVTDNKTAFGSEGSEQRQRIEAVAPTTRIMTLGEFERFCKGPKS
jgi:hypothetical protein